MSDEELEAGLKTIRNLAEAQSQSVRMIEARAKAIAEVVGIILEARAKRLAAKAEGAGGKEEGTGQ